MKAFAVVLFLTIAMMTPAIAGSSRQNQSLVKTPVIITSFFARGNTGFVEGNIRGASSTSRLVLFLRLANQRGLNVAADESGSPQLPRIIGNLPPPSFETRDMIEVRWEASFFLASSRRAQEIYVVACDVRQRGDSSPEGDYRNFQYLPFREALDIDDALALLRDYGWSPTGFTRIAVSP